MCYGSVLAVVGSLTLDLEIRLMCACLRGGQGARAADKKNKTNRKDKEMNGGWEIYMVDQRLKAELPSSNLNFPHQDSNVIATHCIVLHIIQRTSVPYSIQFIEQRECDAFNISSSSYNSIILTRFLP